MTLRLNGSTSGSVSLDAPATGSNVTLELPTDSIKPGLVLVTTQTFTTAATVSVNNCFTSAYDNYALVMRVTGTSNVALNVRMRASAADDSSSNYHTQYLIAAAASVTAAQAVSQTTGRIGQVDTVPQVYTVMFYSPSVATATGWLSDSLQIDATPTHERWGAVHNVATAYDGFTLSPASGTITGSLQVYGYRKAL